jgi:hypothetical protein
VPPPSFVFFIKAGTQPVDPESGISGSGTSTILYNAPSQEAAEQWAKEFVGELLLKGHPEQKLTNLQLLPVHERLITPVGDEPIPWHALIEYARLIQRIKPSVELGSSTRFSAPNLAKTTAPDRYDLKTLKKSIPNSDRYNWDEKKQSYYVLYHENRAFIVRAMNKFLTLPPFIRAVQGSPDGDHSISIRTFPGATGYQN